MSPCNCDKNKINLSLIDDVLDEYAAVPGSLITILQKAQDIYGYLPTDVIKYISDKHRKKQFFFKKKLFFLPLSL